MLIEDAAVHGWSSDIRTLNMVGGLIRREFRVAYRRDGVCSLLHDYLNFSRQKPATVAGGKNGQWKRKWPEKEWPKLKRTKSPFYTLLH